MNILIIILLSLNVLFLISLIIMQIRLNKIRNEYWNFKRTKYRDSNKIVMVEYYLRNYKEGENIFTLFRDLNNLIYYDTERETK